ncbi:cadherin repeat domain-containing protein [bacterium]|nr:cadherin repeat domain-containing protein [bacterium]
MGFWSYLFPGDEGELADLFWSNQQTSTEITLKNQTYEGTNGEDTVTFAQSFDYNPYQSEVYLSGGNDAARTVGTSSGTTFYLGDGDDFFTAIDGLRYSWVYGGRGDDTLRINESLWDNKGLYHSIIITGEGNDYVLIEKEDRLADSRSGVLGGGIFTGNENDTLIIKGNGLLVQSTGASLTYTDGSETRDGRISLGGGDDFLGIYKWNASPPAGSKSAGNSPYLLDSDVYLGEGNDTLDLRSLDFFSSTGVIINGGVGNDIAILPLGITSPPAWLQEFESFVYSPNNGNGTSGHIAGNGAFQEGVTLTAPDITADPDGDAVDPNYAYQWFKDGTAIADATAATYAVPLTGAGTYKVAITYIDGLGFQATVESPEQVVSIFNNGNEPSTALNLSKTSFAENIATGSTVATLSTSDPDLEDTHTYALVSGDGDADNSAFAIDGNQLKVVNSPDFETKSSYSIRLQTKDSGGLTFQKAFTLRVNDLDEVSVIQSLDEVSTQKKVTTFKMEDMVAFAGKDIDTVMVGTKKKDKITGTSDSEILAGMKGKDVLKGGESADGFFFNQSKGFGNKYADKIKDFDSEEGDSILLDDDLFILDDELTLKSFSNKNNVKKEAKSKNDFIYDEKKGLLYFNENGKEKGWGDGGLFAKLQGAPVLGADDFSIV